MSEKKDPKCSRYDLRALEDGFAALMETYRRY